MQLLPLQQNVCALRDLACAGVDLLTSNQFELLVARYGYAMALGRDPVDAVRCDLAKALSDTSGGELLQMRSNDMPIVFYQDNDSCLRAAIDCKVPTQAGRSVWVSFVVTATETGEFFTLEGICAEPGTNQPEPDCRGQLGLVAVTAMGRFGSTVAVLNDRARPKADINFNLTNNVKTVRSPSRLIPPRSDKGLPSVLLLSALMTGFGYFLYSSSNLVRCVTVFLMLALCVYAAFMNRLKKRRFKGMSSVRDGESICNFARSFDTRHTDTWVIRAAHQEIQQLLKSYMQDFPVRASDCLLDDLHIDSDDIEDLLVDIAARSGHSLDETEKNPFYGKINTVSDLVLFVNAQPRMTTV